MLYLIWLMLGVFSIFMQSSYNEKMKIIGGINVFNKVRMIDVPIIIFMILLGAISFLVAGLLNFFLISEKIIVKFKK